MARVRAGSDLMDVEEELGDSPSRFRYYRKRQRRTADQPVLNVAPIQTKTSSGIAVPQIRWGARRKISYKNPASAPEPPKEDLQLVAVGASESENRYLSVPREMHGRWSAERYAAAQESLVQILHDKKAVPGEPILRHDLRAEARKYIGDTGLLDHLLKHMSDRVVTSGQRFRRRHNSEGTMEYWLEDASFMALRKAENIKDPWWIPPPGWKPGDSLPASDAEVIRSLREEVEQLKSELQILSKNELPPAVPSPSFYFPDEKIHDDGLQKALEKRLEKLEAEVHTKFEEDTARAEVTTVEKLTSDAQFTNLWKAVMAMQEKILSIEASMQQQQQQQQQQQAQASMQQQQQAHVNLYNNNHNDNRLVEVSRPSPRSAFVPCSRQRAMNMNMNMNEVVASSAHAFKLCRPQGTFLMPGMANNARALVENNPFRIMDEVSPRSVSSESGVTTSAEAESEQLFLSAAVQALQDGLRSGGEEPYEQQSVTASWLGLGPSKGTLLHA